MVETECNARPAPLDLYHDRLDHGSERRCTERTSTSRSVSSEARSKVAEIIILK